MGGGLQRGHAAALFTIAVWGTTFISTKVLLSDFQPVEILFIRFAMGLAALSLACPRRIKGTTVRQELVFAGAGLFGVCFYFLLENIALTYTSASNVGVIVAAAPFFTAMLSRMVFGGEERLGACFFVGLAVAMAGVFLISFNGAELQFNPAGDVLALAASLVWACYSVLMKKIGGYGFGTVQVTRHVFFYGVVFMLPALLLFGFDVGMAELADPVNAANLLFLGLGASALCFVTWNYAVKILGAVRTSVYIYLNPVITVAAGVLILHEPLTWMTVLGTALALTGLLVSEGRGIGGLAARQAKGRS